MLKNLTFPCAVVVSATKNISDLGSTKDVNVTITSVLAQDSYSHKTGIEKLVHQNRLTEEGKYIKLSCSYSTDKEGKVLLPVKVLFRSNEHQYRTKVYYDYELTDEVLEDVKFIENVFDSTDDSLKRVFL